MDKLKTYIKKVIREIIDEESTSADAGAYSSPLAFKKQKTEIKIQPNTLNIEVGDILKTSVGQYKVYKITKFTGSDDDMILVNDIKNTDKTYQMDLPSLTNKIKNREIKLIKNKSTDNIEESIDKIIKKELLNEITYGKFKNEVSHRTKSEQLHKAIREVKRKIQEIDRIVDYTARMKQELSEGDGLKYWKTTADNMSKINEMIDHLSNKIKSLNQ